MGRWHLQAAGLRLALTLFAPAAGAADPSEFDHWTTGFPLSGAHARVSCESCHTGGVFRGTPSECSACHGGIGLGAATRKPMNHVPSSNGCDDCHTTTSFSHARFDHSGVAEPCQTCHNGAWAGGKNARHLPTSNRCEDCHTPVVWSHARFSHDGILDGCFVCHDGTRAPGKTRNHLPTSNLCEDCHDTRVFSNARMNHVGIATNCFQCHNNRLVPGKNPQHIPAPDTCEICHNTTSWK